MSMLGDPPAAPTPEEVREALAGVLPDRSLLERALEPVGRFLEWLRDLMPSPEVGNPNVSAGGMTALGYVIIGVLAMALLVLLVVAVLRWVSVPKRDGGADDDGPTIVTEELDDPGALASEAETLLADGRYREALLATYRQCVAELVVRNWVPRSRARTTGELRGDVRAGLDEVADEFGALTAAFEDAWFGAYEVDRSTVSAARARAESVIAVAVAAGRAPTPIDDDRPVEVIEL